MNQKFLTKGAKGMVLAFLVLIALTTSVLVITQTASTNPDVIIAQVTTEQTRQIQSRLKYLGYFKVEVTGYYGPITTDAVYRYQRDNGRTPTGQPDGWTLRMLGVSSSGTSGSITNSDLYLLAKCIHAEARGEPYIGQVAVAAVILNRVKNPQFPNSISGVIYQPYAFTAVADGQINLEPNQNAYNAARDAMNGWDPSYGAIYYFNPRTATSAWIWSRPHIITIGQHRFCS